MESFKKFGNSLDEAVHMNPGGMRAIMAVRVGLGVT
jgi:hypothetical protein